MAMKSMCSRQNMKARKSWYMVSGRRMVAKPTSTSFLNCVGLGSGVWVGGLGRGMRSGFGVGVWSQELGSGVCFGPGVGVRGWGQGLGLVVRVGVRGWGEGVW